MSDTSNEQILKLTRDVNIGLDGNIQQEVDNFYKEREKNIEGMFTDTDITITPNPELRQMFKNLFKSQSETKSELHKTPTRPTESAEDAYERERRYKTPRTGRKFNPEPEDSEERSSQR